MIVEETIQKLRTHSGWWNGDETARRVLADVFKSIENGQRLKEAEEKILSLQNKLKEIIHS